jgi:phosphatidylethanolamine-binding protein (PEBP) family uncharacterized protein
MKIYYDDNEIKNKQFLTPTETNKQPIVKYTCNNNDNGKNNLYSLIMYDPDSIHGTYIHWAVINIPNNDIKNGDILLPYKGPSPPYNTGKHRYIFNLYKQSNKIEKIQIENRDISSIKDIIDINKPISNFLFFSEYEYNKKGGKNKTKKNKTKKNKTKKNKTKKNKTKKNKTKKNKTKKYKNKMIKRKKGGMIEEDDEPVLEPEEAPPLAQQQQQQDQPIEGINENEIDNLLNEAANAHLEGLINPENRTEAPIP